jgi:hypothetical protein
VPGRWGSGSVGFGWGFVEAGGEGIVSWRSSIESGYVYSISPRGGYSLLLWYDYGDIS